MQRNLIRTTLLAALMSIAAIVNTSGSHAGGHGHSDTTINEPGDATRITCMVHVDMTDTMCFMPTQITVQRGETIRFEIINSRQMWHEMALGTPADLVAHAEQMRKRPEMEYADANTVVVNPGRCDEIVWHFTHAGSIEFACLQPGHFEAGIYGTVQVRDNRS